MENIKFDDGYLNFAINDDEHRILRVNPTDPNMIPRLKASADDLKEKMKKYKDMKVISTGDGIGEASEAIKQLNNELRENFDSIFYPGASDIVFGYQNPFAMVASTGKTVYETFLDAFYKVISPYIEETNRKTELSIKKYKDEYDRLPSGNA